MKVNDNKSIHQISKLTWACRRGMLELDVLLGNFLKEAYPLLSESDQYCFVTLLNATDPEIFSWVMGHEIAEDQDMKLIAEKVRKHAISRR